MDNPTWLFDLDNTLHDASPHIFPQINRAMRDYIERHLGLDRQAANQIRQHYWERYGATLLGLIRHHPTPVTSRPRTLPGGIQQQGQVRTERALHRLLETGNQRLRQPPSPTLIGVARIGESVTDHPLPLLERRPDEFPKVGSPRREHQQQLGQGWHRPLPPCQQHLADLLCHGNSARFPGHDHALAGRPQALGNECQVGGLSGTLDTLQGDEGTTS